MKLKCLMIFIFICFLSFTIKTTFSQDKSKESYSKIGGLKLPDVGYGVFGSAAHINKDSTFTDYIPYYSKFALLVGAINSKGEIWVTSGTGNAITQRPEWAPDHNSFSIKKNTSFSQVEKIVTTQFTDAVKFDGHKPMGLNVNQEVYGFVNTNFSVLNFTISLEPDTEELRNLFIGMWIDVDATDSENNLTSTDDQIEFALNGKAPFILDNNFNGNEAPLLGAMILGTDEPIVSWWQDKNFPASDQEQYAYLKGEVPKAKHDKPGDYQFLLSYGPITLKAGESVQFPVAIVQAPELSDFEDNLYDAKEFYTEKLNGIALKKNTPALEGLTETTLSSVPKAFHLSQNFPNPFNPETQIRFDLMEATRVELRIYNTLGQLVRTLVNKDYSAGSFTVTWNGRDDTGIQLSSGIYIYHIKAGKFQAQRKLLFLK